MRIQGILVGCLMVLAAGDASAAYGEMGTGVPSFGVYGQPNGPYIAVWSLADQTRPMAAGCTTLYIMPATIGLDTYKMAFATLTAAKLSGKRVRLYAHADRDGGCGVDFIQLED